MSRFSRIFDYLFPLICECEQNCLPAVSAFALSVAGAKVSSGAPGAVNVVALTVLAVNAVVRIREALAHPSADAGAAPVADHARVFWILATCYDKSN